jgi:CBS domain-containing protein
MRKVITAGDLLKSSYHTIAPDRRVADAIGLMLDARADGCGAETLLVIDEGGAFRGLLTTRQLFQSLLSRWLPEGADATPQDLDDRQAIEERLADEGREYLMLEVGQLRKEDVEPLARMMRSFARQQLQSIPVVEAGRVLGVVLVVDVYETVAQLAITPEDEGIRLDR